VIFTTIVLHVPCEHEGHTLSKKSDTKKEENQFAGLLVCWLVAEKHGVFAPLLHGFAWENMPFRMRFN
jgi:hypothetical protein